jgi:NO-binding membrane sensor protein with MHYT domain
MDFTYDPALVALSVALCVLGAFTGLVVTSGLKYLQRHEAILRIMLGALGIGGGIWAMNFVALIALVLPVDPSFGIVNTLTSASVVIIFTGFALGIICWRKRGIPSYCLGALCITAGLAAMYWLSIDALTASYRVGYYWFGLVVSLAIAFQASAAMLWFAFRERAVLDTFLGSLALGLAIAAAHYSAVEAAHIVPLGSALLLPGSTRVDYSLALSVAIAVYAVCGFCIGIFTLVSYIKRARPKAQRGAAR